MKIKSIIIAIILLLFLNIIPVLALEEVATLYYEGNYQEALTRMEGIEPDSIKLDNSEYYLQLAYLNLEKGNMDEYISNLKLVEKYDTDINLELKIAIGHFLAGSYEKSQQYFSDIFYQFENDEQDFQLGEIQIKRLFYYKGKNELALGNYQQAQKSWEQGLEVKPSYSLYDIALAELYEKLGNHKKALAYYQNSLSKDSSLNYLFPRLASLAEKIKEYEKAWEYWQKSIDTGILTEKATKRRDQLEEKFPGIKPELKEEKEEKWDPNWSQVDSLDLDIEIPPIEIGIGDLKEEVIFQVDSPFRIVNENGVIILTKGEAKTEWKIAVNENGELEINKGDRRLVVIPGNYDLEIIPLREKASIMIKDIPYGRGYFWSRTEDRQYRGEMKIATKKNTQKEQTLLEMVNKVNLEEYLLSVVPAEMSASWPQEALKVQALAARSYAYYNMERRHRNDDYNLCDTVHCAVYRGVTSEHQRSSQAVINTVGEVGLYEGEVINAVFSSNTGGLTEASKEIWGSNFSYLTGNDLRKQKDFELPFLPKELVQWNQTLPETYSGPGSYSYSGSYRWSRLISSDFLKKEHDLEFIEDIVVQKRTPHGYVREILIKGSQEDVQITGDIIRSSLGGIKSNNFFIYRKYNEQGNLDWVKLYGSGWGHGVGMDQTAAARMTLDNIKYEEIFTYFYKNVEIDTLY